MLKNEWLVLLTVLGLCAVLSGCGSASSSSKGSGSGQPAVTVSAKSVSFGNQPVGTTSPPQMVTLSNTGDATLNITSISVSGQFAGTNTCGTTVDAGKNCTISLTFAPTISGNLVGSVAITDNASGSPQSISLAGVGTGGSGGGGTACAGTPITQAQTDVTSQLSFVNTTGNPQIKVSQLTDTGANRFYYFDVPAYSALVKQILYVNFVSGNQIITSNSDGTGAQIISASQTGEQSFLSEDGKLAYYDKPVLGGTPGGVDLFGVLLNASGSCQEIRLTNLDVPPQAPLPVWQISSSSPDPSANGQDIAFSPDTLLHGVHVKLDGTSQVLPTVTLNDPESGATFHRIRLNPKFPNILMYKRNGTGGGQPELWLVDLNTCTGGNCPASNIINVVQNLPVPSGFTPKAGHVIWSPDGLDIAFSEPDIGDYWIAKNVVKSDGTLNLTNGGIPSSSLQELGPFASPQLTADYCVFPPNWPISTVLACVAGPASASHAKTFYLMSSDGKGTTKLLAASDAQVLNINGTPLPQFVQDDQHLLFNSDRTTTTSVQVYMISGFTATVP